MKRLTDELFGQIADRFKALAEPARLRILDALRHDELTVGELGERTGLNQANLSKHLQLLHALAFVARRKDGLFVRYSLRNDDVFALCDIMCGGLANRAARPRPAANARRSVALSTPRSSLRRSRAGGR
jgi:ArsR family transcriptional regulator, arsenate/arsenite/antimonite-responsive transcriptional repressor